MKRYFLFVLLVLFSIVTQAQNIREWYDRVFFNDILSLDIPMSSTLDIGYSVDVVLEYRCKSESLNQGWAFDLRLNDGTYSYTKKNVEGSNLVTAEVYVTDYMAGAVYRQSLSEEWSLAFSLNGGLSLISRPTVNASNEQVMLRELVPVVRPECAIEWYLWEDFGFIVSVSYNQHLARTPFSSDLLHDAVFNISVGITSN